MPKSSRLQIRETEEELQKLDEAIKKLGYRDRADWYRDMKRQTIARAMAFTHKEKFVE